MKIESQQRSISHFRKNIHNRQQQSDNNIIRYTYWPQGKKCNSCILPKCVIQTGTVATTLWIFRIAHKFSKSAFVGRANVGHVSNNTQLLFEADYYQTISKKNYLYINAGVSTGETVQKPVWNIILPHIKNLITFWLEIYPF